MVKESLISFFDDFSAWASGRTPGMFAAQPDLISATLDAPPLYRTGDRLGLVLAYASLIPAFIVFYRGSTLFHDRSWVQLQLFLGTGCNAVFSKALKEIVRIERPQATCEALGLCGDLGWPSTHSQISAFAFFTMLLRRKGQAPLSPGRTAAEAAEIWILALLTASVAWSRVYLGYHDVQQITAGLVFGTVSAAAWHALCQHNIVRRVLEPVLRPFKPLVPHLKES